MLFEWIRQESGLDLGVDEVDTVQRLDGPARDDLLEDRVETWMDRYRAESRAEGLRTGRAEGRAEERRTITCQNGNDLLAHVSKDTNGRE